MSFKNSVAKFALISFLFLPFGISVWDCLTCGTFSPQVEEDQAPPVVLGGGVVFYEIDGSTGVQSEVQF